MFIYIDDQIDYLRNLYINVYTYNGKLLTLV